MLNMKRDDDSNVFNVKKFKKADIKEGRDPLFDDDHENDDEKTHKVSLSHILRHLESYGDSFSDTTIYKVSIPKSSMERALKTGQKPITHVMVDATLNVYMDEPAVTIYLRNVSHSVETRKIFNKVIEE